MAERLDCSLMASMASTKKKGCKYSEDRGRQSEAVFQDSDFTHLKSPIWGLGCNSNLSLNFYILDSVTQWSLLHKLKAKGQNEGSDDNHPQVPKAMIISLNDDKIFAMKGRWLDRQNLKNFIRAFHGLRKERPEGPLEAAISGFAERPTENDAKNRQMEGGGRNVRREADWKFSLRTEEDTVIDRPQSLREADSNRFVERLVTHGLLSTR